MLNKPTGKVLGAGEGVHGHGSVETPKKPDGTKGFTRGRGRATLPEGVVPPKIAPGSQPGLEAASAGASGAVIEEN